MTIVTTILRVDNCTLFVHVCLCGLWMSAYDTLSVTKASVLAFAVDDVV